MLILVLIFKAHIQNCKQQILAASGSQWTDFHEM